MFPASTFRSVYPYLHAPLLRCMLRRCFASVQFGYEKVDEAEKAGRVGQVFSRVATKYDQMNDMMSLGIHRLWKDYFVQQLQIGKDSQIIDVAGGTGDIAFRMQKCFERHGATGSSSITVVDINEDMLKMGEARAVGPHSRKLKWVCGNAEELPFSDNAFDLYTIAFGIRNCTHIDKVLAEAYRVLRPGGQFACLEFSRVESPLLRSVYDLYSFQVIPVLGQVVAGDFNSYKYLVESIRLFPDQETFAEMIRKAGFTDSCYENLSGGICAIHLASKGK